MHIWGNVDLKNKSAYNATYPIPYCRKKLSPCIYKSPEYRCLSLNEDTNQTRKWRLTKHETYTPRGHNLGSRPCAFLAGAFCFIKKHGFPPYMPAGAFFPLKKHGSPSQGSPSHLPSRPPELSRNYLRIIPEL